MRPSARDFRYDSDGVYAELLQLGAAPGGSGRVTARGYSCCRNPGGVLQAGARRVPVTAVAFCAAAAVAGSLAQDRVDRSRAAFLATGDARGQVAVWDARAAAAPLHLFETYRFPIRSLLWSGLNLGQLLVVQQKDSCVLNLLTATAQLLQLPEMRWHVQWATTDVTAGQLQGCEITAATENAHGFVLGWSHGMVANFLLPDGLRKRRRKGGVLSTQQYWFDDANEGVGAGAGGKRTIADTDAEALLVPGRAGARDQ